MKKILALLLAVVFIFVLSACESARTSSDISDSSVAVPSEVESEEATSQSTQTSEPTVSSEPVESVQSSKPVESSEFVESSEPTETSEPTVSSTPTESESAQSAPVESSEPVQSSKPAETSKPSESSKPTESSKPAQSSKPVDTTTPSANQTTLESTNSTDNTSTETNTNKLTDDAFGSYSLAIIETDPNSPITFEGDLNLYGLYISGNPTESTFFSNTAVKPESPDELIGLAPGEQYTYNGEKYVVVFDGGFDPNTFKEFGDSITNTTIDLENGLITLGLSQNSEPLILKHYFENGIHKLIAQNNYIENIGGINVTLIPIGSVFTKN